MLKGSCISFCLICWVQVIFGQNPTLTINETALLNGQITLDASGYNYNTGLAILPQITVRSNAANLAASSGSNTIPVNRFTVAVVRGATVGGTVILSTATQQITGSLLGLLGFTSGPFSVRYSSGSLSSFAWKAGNYTTGLLYSTSSIGIGTSVTPQNVTLTVVVPAFITALNEPGDVELLVNNLSYFRGTALAVNKTITHRHSVPLMFRLKGNSSLFTFTNGYNGVPAPQTNINTINAKMTSPVPGTQITLSNVLQTLSSGTVPTGNTTTNIAQYSISAANLLSGFINKGTYSNTLDMELNDADAAYPAATYTKSLNVRVIVSDLSELSVNTAAITLKFLTADHYRNGVAVDVANHLVASKTTPYDITVKSDNANFTFGANTIPVSVLSIGPSTGQTGVNTINSLSTLPQVLVNAASPEVDRNISLRYFIPASKTENLLNKQAGTYTTSVTYTLTAH